MISGIHTNWSKFTGRTQLVFGGARDRTIRTLRGNGMGGRISTYHLNVGRMTKWIASTVNELRSSVSNERCEPTRLWSLHLRWKVKSEEYHSRRVSITISGQSKRTPNRTSFLTLVPYGTPKSGDKTPWIHQSQRTMVETSNNQGILQTVLE